MRQTCLRVDMSCATVHSVVSVRTVTPKSNVSRYSNNEHHRSTMDLISFRKTSHVARRTPRRLEWCIKTNVMSCSTRTPLIQNPHCSVRKDRVISRQNIYFQETCVGRNIRDWLGNFWGHVSTMRRAKKSVWPHNPFCRGTSIP